MQVGAVEKLEGRGSYDVDAWTGEGRSVLGLLGTEKYLDYTVLVAPLIRPFSSSLLLLGTSFQSPTCFVWHARPYKV